MVDVLLVIPVWLTSGLQVQAILMCLQDPRMAKKNLLGSMAKFQSDMENCAKWAEDTEAQFGALVKCALEVNSAMADEMGMMSL